MIDAIQYIVVLLLALAPILFLAFFIWKLDIIFTSKEPIPENTYPEQSADDLAELRKISLHTAISNDEVEKELAKLIGATIQRVYYIVANNYEHEFNHMDSIDFGVILKLDGSRYLNWIWQEGEADWEKETHFPTGFYIDFSNKVKDITSRKTIFDAGIEKKWKPFINQKIEHIDLKRNKDYEHQICERLIITCESKQKFGIFSTEEPPKDIDTWFEKGIEFSDEWTAVVFDERYLGL